MGGHADHADGADRHERKGLVVVAAVDLEAVRRGRPQPGRGRDVEGGVLHSHDVGDLAGQAHQDVVGNLAAGADGDVVDEQGLLPGPLGHRPEVGLEAGLGRAVVVGRHDQHAGDAALGRRLGEHHRMAGVVGARARHHRHGDGFDHCPPQVELLLVGEHRSLTCGARHHQSLVAAVHQGSGHRRGGVEVEGALLREGRDHGSDHIAEPGAHDVTSCSAER